jgi:hypothetical protein
VTVCVAVLCNERDAPVIFGASDRMLTAGSIEFEPPQTKYVWLTRSIVMMIAGDVAFEAEVIREVRTEVQARVASEPANWWLVADVANLYARRFLEARRRLAEAVLLGPVGLDMDGFISRQAEMQPDFIRMLATELLNMQVPDAECLIVGVDPTGAHIYRGVFGRTTCEDVVGFAAIGGGAGHAESHLMLQGHIRGTPLAEGMLSAYFAKRRGEIAPGVGEATDMFMIGPQLGQSWVIGEAELVELKKIHSRERRAARAADKRARREVNAFVQKLLAAQAQQQQSSSPPDTIGDGDSSADGETGRTSTDDDTQPPNDSETA